MKILVVCKRRPQQRDLVDRPYGRFHHLPIRLASLGHEVRVLLIGHQGEAAVRQHVGGVEWIGLQFRGLGARGLLAALDREADSLSPDWVMGVSDAWYGWLAHRLARRTRARLAIDAYDNYEAYMPWNFPLHWLWRRAIAAADLVTAAGPQLAARLDRHRSDNSQTKTKILPMAADPDFVPLDKSTSRAALGLPIAAPLLGYYGGWAANRGTEMLVQAFREVRSRKPEAMLVLTGKPPADVLREPGVRGLGYIDDAQLPAFVNALDVACVVTANSNFGKYSYPAKLCEAMACGTPVVATDTAPVRWMLRGNEQFLAPVGDAKAFAASALQGLELGCVDYGELPSWDAAAGQLDTWLRSPRGP